MSSSYLYSLTVSGSHSFCYLCIIQWSELSRLCPLCKKYYTALIHTVTRDLDYQEVDCSFVGFISATSPAEESVLILRVF